MSPMPAAPLWYSKAIRRPVHYVNQLPDLDLSRPTWIGHTNGGPAEILRPREGSLFHWFDRPGNDVCAHGQIMLDGTVEQYVPLNKQAYAQYDGNLFAWSWEHEDDGDPNTPLTDAQLAADADIIRELGVPLVLASAGGPGVGWHSLHPAEWNRSGHNCPGPVREAQFRTLLLPPVPTTVAEVLEAEPMLIIRNAKRPAALVTSPASGPLARYLSDREWQALYRIRHGADVNAAGKRDDGTVPNDDDKRAAQMIAIVARPVAEHDALTGGLK